MKTTKYIFLICLISLFASCKKDPPAEPEPTEPVMPPATQIGANTFGCYIDGELFVANDGESVWSAPPVSGSFDEETLLLAVQGNREFSGTEGTADIDNIRLRVIVDSGVNSYDLHFETDHYLGYFSLGYNRCRYYHDLNNRGTCEITYLDIENNIIAGKFKMTLINPDCEIDTLMKITDGRFDFRY